MLLQVYSPRFAPWLIVDGQPSRAALDAFGALRLEGSFQADRLTASEHRFVLRDLTALTYARVPKDTARRLMAHSPIRQIKQRLTRWWPTRYTPLPCA